MRNLSTEEYQRKRDVIEEGVLTSGTLIGKDRMWSVCF